MPELLQPGHLAAGQAGDDFRAALLRGPPEHRPLGIDELGPLGQDRFRLGRQPRPAEQPGGGGPLAAAQRLADGLDRGRVRRGVPVLKQQGHRGHLRQQRRLLEPHQPAQGGRALALGQAGQHLHPRLPRPGVERLVVPQIAFDLRRIVLGGPFHPHQPQQVLRPGGDLRVRVGGGGGEGLEGLEAQAGQLVLRPLTHVIVLVAQLADQLVDLFGRRRLLGGRRGGLGRLGFRRDAAGEPAGGDHRQGDSGNGASCHARVGRAQRVRIARLDAERRATRGSHAERGNQTCRWRKEVFMFRSSPSRVYVPATARGRTGRPTGR